MKPCSTPSPTHPLTATIAVLRAELFALDAELTMGGFRHVSVERAGTAAGLMRTLADALEVGAQGEAAGRIVAMAAERRRETDRASKARRRAVAKKGKAA